MVYSLLSYFSFHTFKFHTQQLQIKTNLDPGTYFGVWYIFHRWIHFCNLPLQPCLQSLTFEPEMCCIKAYQSSILFSERNRKKYFHCSQFARKILHITSSFDWWDWLDLATYTLTKLALRPQQSPLKINSTVVEKIKAPLLHEPYWNRVTLS